MSLLKEWSMIGKKSVTQPYQQVEYIATTTSSNSAYIEIPYTPVLGDSLYVLANWDGASAKICSCGASDYIMQAQASSNKFYINNMTNYNMNCGTAEPGKWYEFSIPGNGNCTIKDVAAGTVQSKSIPQVQAPDDTSIWLFASKSGGVNSTKKISAFRIDRGGTALINLIPCYRKSDNAVGFYDTVGDAFYAGDSRYFTKGPDVN